AVYAGASLGALPAWDGSDVWPVAFESVEMGRNLAVLPADARRGSPSKSPASPSIWEVGSGGGV
ncbi:MAG: hypothetical protein L0177_11765, partial [Chloroflexi bacterium]|nr:hypothetical protein [Chloroflexota bacterium]